MGTKNNSERFTFDSTDSVSEVRGISTEAIHIRGGPEQYVEKRSESVSSSWKRIYNGTDLGKSSTSDRGSRLVQNRRSAKANFEKRKEQARAMSELNIAASVQGHALSRTEDYLNHQINEVSKQLTLSRLKPAKDRNHAAGQ